MSAGDGWAGTVVDVSKWQSSLPDLSGVMGVICRAGIGTKPDLTFVPFTQGARRAGKWTGSYWYGIGNLAVLTVSEEVDAYIRRELEVGGVQLHVLDWEGADGFSAAQAADFMRIYKARTLNSILLYASEGRFRDLGQDGNWIANYSNMPVKDFDMWQYGVFRGVDGNLAKQRIIDLTKERTLDMSISTRGLTLTTDFAVDLPAGSDVLDAPGGTKIGDFGGTYDVFGIDGIYKVIRVATATGSQLGFCGTSATIYKKAVVPVIDTTPFSQADIDKARTDQKAADQVALNVATAALTSAAATERERLALSLAAGEADRVRNA